MCLYSAQSQNINIPDANFKNVLINSDCASFIDGVFPDGDVDLNNDGEIQVSEAEAVLSIRLNSRSIASMVGIESFVNVEQLYCDNNDISSLDVSKLTKLRVLNFERNNLTSINLINNNKLENFKCGSNQFGALDVSELINLKILNCYNNQLTDLNVSNNSLLEFLSCSKNNLLTLSVDANPELKNLYVEFNELTTLDISNNPKMSWLFCHANPDLETLFLKNGSILNQLKIAQIDNLKYICADEAEFDFIQNELDANNYSDCVLNSYCSFTPGGDFYTVKGENRLDLGTNGCDENDAFFPFMNFEISNGSETGNNIGNSSGSYTIDLQSGSYTMTPILENPAYFEVSPTEAFIDFPTETSPFIQDFCVTPKGVYNDLEIIILPLEFATSGFNTDYEIIYRNKGNTILSGDIELSFDDNLMDFVTAIPTENNQIVGKLGWDYVNLQPFESRSIYYTLEMNTPTDTEYPLNEGDVLNFTATINPIELDETEPDNVFKLRQVVINSFDPNDKTCLEGEIISPDKVGDFVHYMIRFENLGTANAVNIVVTDFIDTDKFNVSSLMPLKASHSFVTRISETNKVEFVFENINLPFDDGNNDGYISFKIKTLSTLELGDTFSNNAEIYFDFNAPIITNTASTNVAETLSVNNLDNDSVIVCYPNPIHDYLYVVSEDAIKSINFYDINGRLLNNISLNHNQFEKEIHVANLLSGIYFIRIISIKGETLKKLIKN